MHESGGSDGFATIPDVPLVSNTNRVQPNQITTGVSRGVQSSVGTDQSRIDYGVVANSKELAIAEYNAAGQKVLQLGQQSDGSLGLNVPDALGNSILFAGKDNAGNTVVKVAKSGFDARTAASNNLVFNSAQNILKVALTGTTNLPSVATGQSAHVTITHNLGYVPAILAYDDFNGFRSPIPDSAFDYSTGRISYFIDIENLTTTQFDVWAYVSAFGGTLPALSIKYYLLQESAI